MTKPCPFCGKAINLDDEDTLYPDGIGWIDHWEEDYDYRSYVSALEVPKEQWCYKIVCNQIYGGCGAEIHSDSKEEVIEKWEKRAYD